MFCNHGVMNDSCLVLFSKSSFPRIFFVFFSPSDQLVSVDKGEAVMAQREARTPRSVLVLGGTLFDTDGLRGQTGQRDESGKAASNREICLQSVLISL